MIQSGSLIQGLASMLLAELKGLSGALRAVSKPPAQINNVIINRLLLASDRDCLSIVKEILSHLLHIVDLKGINSHILNIVSKVISFIKTYDQHTEKFRAKHNSNLFNQQPSQSEAKPAEIVLKKLSGNSEGSISSVQSEGTLQGRSSQMSELLSEVIDIIVLLKNKNREPAIVLRVMQTTFSLIDYQMLRHVNYHLLTRLYSVCFDCCQIDPTIQNISVSALCSLTEIVFAQGELSDASILLQQFLEYLLRKKKFNWILQRQLRGLIWDLAILAVRSLTVARIQQVLGNTAVLALLQQMYKVSAQRAFVHELKDEPQIKSNKKLQNQKSINFKKGSLPEFIRFYKAFIYFSMHLSLKIPHVQAIPYRESLSLFRLVVQQERTQRTYLFLQGISLLLSDGYTMLIEDDAALILLEILSKFSEELCLSRDDAEIVWDGGDFYLDKMCGDFAKINDSDYVRLIKNCLITLRKHFESRKDSIVQARNDHNVIQQQTERSESGRKSDDNQKSLQNFQKLDDKKTPIQKRKSSQKKRWQRIIQNIISSIRYLTSLGGSEGNNEQPVRKLLLQLQHWFLISPSHKTRNMILQQLLATSSLVRNSMQAVKVSQCVQIGSNLIYGYYDEIDSIGLTLLLRMLANIKIKHEDVRQFDQLEDVYSLLQKMFVEQKLITSAAAFAKTVQGFVQCANSIMADTREVSKGDTLEVQQPIERNLKMIDYVLDKLKIVILQNEEYLSQQWDFLTGFWISFCSSKIIQVRVKTIAHIASITKALILEISQPEKDQQDRDQAKLERGEDSESQLESQQTKQLSKKQIECQTSQRIAKRSLCSGISQAEILTVYAQLSKSGIRQIEKTVIGHLRQIISLLGGQAVAQVFLILRNIVESKDYFKHEHPQLSELQAQLVHQGIFKVKQAKQLCFIIDNLVVTSSNKNEQYKVVELLWSISDHLRALSLESSGNKSLESAWARLFCKLAELARRSLQTETKQACMHTFTQLLASSSPVLAPHLLATVIQEDYLKVFYLLLGIEAEGHDVFDTSQAIERRCEMIRIGVKNYVKIIKKFQGDQSVPIVTVLCETFASILDYLETYNNSLPAEYYYEIGLLLKELSDQNDNCPSLLNKRKLFASIEKSKEQSRFDKTTHFWLKRYEPLLSELKKIYSRAESVDGHLNCK